MKINTLTTFDVYNYGASLQAYALMTYLASLGHDVEIIDYQPDYLTRKYDYKWVNPESPLSRWALTRAAYRVMKYLQRQTTMGRKRAFDRFHTAYLRRTPERYTTAEQIYSNPPQADAYVVGSDQVWNVFYEAGRDDVFFLGFVRNGRRLSYAASFSYMDIDSAQQQRIKRLLGEFDGVGVREYHGVEFLQSIGVESTWTLDPVFLLTPDQWREFASPPAKSEPYVLIYDFENNADLKQFTLEYARKHALKIYSINDTYPCRYAHRNFSSAGPMEFLSLIMNCDAFVSNSFHGSAFSIMFHKPVFVFNRRRHKVNSRMQSLMRLFGLEGNVFDTFTPGMTDTTAQPDFAEINRTMERERAKSIHYLHTSLP